jgi:ribosomal protein S18 acetylase RimI-like enzyme
MSLPILQVHHEPTPIDLVRLFHRTSAMWVTHLAEGESLAAGTAYANRELAALPDANNFRDAALHDLLSAGDAVEQVESHYRQQGVRCAYWVMNPSAPPAQTQPLIDHLLAGGYRRQSDDIFYLRKVALLETPVPADFKVIPARASYRHAEQLAREAFAGPQVDLHVEATLRHLDDPHYDALLALSNDRAVASLGILSVGELAQIQQLYASPTHRRQGLGRLMLNRGLEICARSLSKHIFAQLDPQDEPARALITGFGFTRLATFDRYIAPPPGV